MQSPPYTIAPQPTEPLEHAVRVLRTVTERRAEKAPDRVAAEADRKKEEQELTNGWFATVLIAPCWLVSFPVSLTATSNANSPIMP